MDLAIGTLPHDQWPEAAALAGRAFWTKAYNEVLSEDPFERYAIVQGIYRRMDPTDGSDVVGGFIGDHVVGFAWIDPMGTCWACAVDPGAPAAADGADRVMQQVGLAIRTLHDGLPPHASIGPIAVEPSLQGRGIGRRLLEEAWRRASAGAATVALDCDPRLRTFYETSGFTAVGVVTDPYGFEIVGLRRDPELA